MRKAVPLIIVVAVPLLVGRIFQSGIATAAALAITIPLVLAVFGDDRST